MKRELFRLLLGWRSAFPRGATFHRVVAVLLGLVLVSGRKTLTAAFRQGLRLPQGWAGDYLAFCRPSWNPRDLFDHVFQTAVQELDRIQPDLPVVVALDDTSIKKSSKVIAAAHWMRDPLSPHFHLNLRYGLRFLHAAVILPFHRRHLAPKALSVAFTLTPPVAKPAKNAPEAERKAYRANRRAHNLSTAACHHLDHLQKVLHRLGHPHRRLLAVGDGSFTNRTVLKNLPEGVAYLGRVRKDVRLGLPAPAGGRKIYGEPLPTPEDLRRSDELPWQAVTAFYSEKQHEVRYKEVTGVLWRRGSGRRPLRLLILAPTPYVTRRGRPSHHQPAYLLTTDLTTPVRDLIQAYLDRWQIEVLHREVKTGLGVGQAQVWNPLSVQRVPSSFAAFWALVTLVALRTEGPRRTAAYPERPPWYPQEPLDRPSSEDIRQLLWTSLEREETPSANPIEIRAA